MKTATERLDEALEAVGQPTEDASEHWKVKDAGAADWALRKLQKVEAEIAEVQRIAAEQIRAITAWVEAEQARIGPEIVNWRTRLAIYHRERLVNDPKAKTIRLPHGTLIARKAPDGIDIEDAQALLAWAKAESPDLVRVKEELDRSAVKHAVLKAGEAIPGVTVVEGETRFAVTTDVEEVEG